MTTHTLAMIWVGANALWLGTLAIKFAVGEYRHRAIIRKRINTLMARRF